MADHYKTQLVVSTPWVMPTAESSHRFYAMMVDDIHSSLDALALYYDRIIYGKYVQEDIHLEFIEGYSQLMRTMH